MSDTQSLTREQVGIVRLRSQGVSRSTDTTPLEVVERLGALQAQD